MHPDYPAAATFLGQTVTVVIDRPCRSRHPEHGFTYPINYGYVPGVPAPDGDDLDAYVLFITEPLVTFTGICIAVIHRLNDNDDKLVLVPPGQTATDAQIRAQTWFQEQFFESNLLR
ncbi:MAG: inorganic diphosphatase [Anaerolineaceae bacterium]|nr:inorganic diphosphatase [Anaerolineaceae bacterium]